MRNVEHHLQFGSPPVFRSLPLLLLGVPETTGPPTLTVDLHSQERGVVPLPLQSRVVGGAHLLLGKHPLENSLGVLLKGVEHPLVEFVEVRLELRRDPQLEVLPRSEGVLLEVARAKGRRAKTTGGTVHRAAIYGQLTGLRTFGINVYVREGPVVEANAGHRSF